MGRGPLTAGRCRGPSGWRGLSAGPVGGCSCGPPRQAARGRSGAYGGDVPPGRIDGGPSAEQGRGSRGCAYSGLGRQARGSGCEPRGPSEQSPWRGPTPRPRRRLGVVRPGRGADRARWKVAHCRSVGDRARHRRTRRPSPHRGRGVLSRRAPGPDRPDGPHSSQPSQKGPPQGGRRRPRRYTRASRAGWGRHRRHANQ